MKSLRSGGESLHLVARSNFSHFRRARAGRRCCIMKNSVEASKMERVQGSPVFPMELSRKAWEVQSFKKIEFLSFLTLAGVTGLGKRYRGVLLDQFGVLHDGNKPYPEAIAAVEQMHREGMRIVIVSNSSRRSDGALDKIAKMGFKKEWFVGAITSGEITHQMLAERSPGFWEGLGTHALWFTWGSRGAISLDGTGVVATRDIARGERVAWPPRRQGRVGPSECGAWQAIVPTARAPFARPSVALSRS